jgi:glycosyltransferase involved in cell wall biosynthesis
MSGEKAPLVSVIMNCFNGERYLREAMDSVYSQTYPNWEIIFWDNASTDASGEIVRSYDDRIRYFRGTETIPLGAARNLALEQARGEFIAFLDCDDVWLPDKLEKQLPLFSDAKVGIVFCDTMYFNDKGEQQRLYSRKKYYTGSCFDKLLVDNFLSLPSVVIRRASLIEQKEWFDLRFSMNEECDLFIRISFNWHLAMVPEPLAKWRLHSASLSSRRKAGFADEYEDMLVKYQDYFPDFNARFAREIRTLKEVIALIRARDAWESGDWQAVRRYAAPQMFSSPRALTYYLMTFFPRGLAQALINRLSAIRIGSATDQ